MANLTIPRVFISGTSSGVGKSFITVGLVAALVQRGISVNVCLHGVRLPQAILYKRITLRDTAVLDSNLLHDNQLLESFRLASVGAEVVLIDGNLGLFDGQHPDSLKGSDSALASLLKTPTLLVFDGGVFGTTAGALVKGIGDIAKEFFKLEGAIANWLDQGMLSVRNRRFFDTALSLFESPPNLGAVPLMESASRRENLLPGVIASQDTNRTLLGRAFILELSKLISESVDIDKILEIANKAEPIHVDGERESSKRRCRIAVSDDSCFHLGFPDNLAILRDFGAELVTFSPLADVDLPERIGAVYLTGAYLTEYGADLSANMDMRRALLDFAQKGGAIYSEGGGTAFLCSEYLTTSTGGQTAKFQSGVGILSGKAIPVEETPDYIGVELVEPSVLGEMGVEIRGVDSAEWRYESSNSSEKLVFIEKSSHRSRPVQGVSPYPNVVATFAFLHFGSNPQVAAQLVASAERCSTLLS